MPRPAAVGVFLRSNAVRREPSRTAEKSSDNDNRPLVGPPPDTSAATADRFRRVTLWLALASTIVAVAMDVALHVRVDPQGSLVLDWVLGALLLASRLWWQRSGHERIADASGVMALVCLGGMSCAAVAMLELRLRFPMADATLLSFDHALGIDGIAITGALLQLGHWIFWIMAPAYNFTLQIFFGGMVVLALVGDRIEAWRAAFCFVGTLLTTCLVAMFAPAKGLGVWAPHELLAQLPDQSMRTFWPHFNDFYFGADPVLRLQVIDGVISFPSFHAVVGFLVLAMWRKNVFTLTAAGMWLSVMLLATLPGGGHYIVDLIGGFTVWAVWFVLSRRLEAGTWRQPVPAVAALADEPGGA